jgi:hypothetical protein
LKEAISMSTTTYLLTGDELDDAITRDVLDLIRRKYPQTKLRRIVATRTRQDGRFTTAETELRLDPNTNSITPTLKERSR